MSALPVVLSHFFKFMCIRLVPVLSQSLIFAYNTTTLAHPCRVTDAHHIFAVLCERLHHCSLSSQQQWLQCVGWLQLQCWL